MDDKRHIIFCDFVTHYGGASRSNVQFAAAMSKHVKVSLIDPYGICKEYRRAIEEAGLDYHVLCPEAKEMLIGGLHGRLARLLRVFKSLPGLLKVRRRAVRKIRDLGATVVVGNNPKSLMLAATSWRLRKLPLVAWMRGWYTPDMIPWYAEWLYKRRCRRLIAVSYATRAALHCQGVALDRIFVVQNPVDVEAVEWQASRPLLADLPQVDRPVRILLPGALLRTKGQHTAIRALRRVVDAGQDGVLWLAGDPPNHLAEGYVAWAHQLAEDLGVTDRVVWLGMRRDLPQIMKRATLVVLPTHTEGFSRAVVEAMALGRPVIGTPVGGMLDQLINGVTGLVIEVEDDAALAEGILDLTRRPDYASELAENGRRFVVRNLGVEQQTQKALAALCGPSYSRHRETSPA